MLFILIIAAICIALDQITKIIVSTNMSLFESREIISNFFYFTYVRNDGIAWGIDAKLWILILITIVAIGIFLFLGKGLSFKNDKWYIITLGLMLGGTLGNFIDRIFQKDHSVIDFLDFLLYYPSFKGEGFISYDFPIFNVADSFLVVGAIMFVIFILFIEPKKNKKLKEEEKEEKVEVVKE